MIIKLFSLSPASVEKYYSNGLYPWIGFVQRILFGWIPFSIGDILYAFTGAWLLLQVIRLIKRFRNKTADKRYLIAVGGRILTGVLIVYVVFNILWGLNYNRTGIDHQMQLAKLDYEDKDLLEVSRRIAGRMNELHHASKANRNNLDNKRYLFRGAIKAYRELSGKNSMFLYSYPSVKPSIFSYLGNYLGFTGYYNPFTGEAQVNTTTPFFIRPFTTCHEIGHQLGYAKESRDW